jgi:uncharacterized damage-inducible protein DinB
MVITPAYLQHMALYNRWQNERLYALCTDLGEAERKRQRGMFFGSIHKTLDHILYIDRAILQMVQSGQRPTLDVSELLYDDFTALAEARRAFDAELEQFASEHDVAWLEQKANPSFRVTRALMLMQLFNHQTHHRSQVTSELHKLGIDYGVTDMPYNPYLPVS